MGLIKTKTIIGVVYTTTQNLDVLSNNSSLIEFNDNQAETYGKKIIHIMDEINDVIAIEFLGSNNNISFIEYDGIIIEKNEKNI